MARLGNESSEKAPLIQQDWLLDNGIEAKQETLRNWVVQNHTVSLDVIENVNTSDGVVTFHTEGFTCHAGHARISCEGITEVTKQYLDQARRLNENIWAAAGSEQALTDIVERIAIYGEWLGQRYYKRVWAQEVGEMLGIDYHEVMFVASKLRPQGIINYDGFVLYPGQQMFLKHRINSLDLHWVI